MNVQDLDDPRKMARHRLQIIADLTNRLAAGGTIDEACRWLVAQERVGKRLNFAFVSSVGHRGFGSQKLKRIWERRAAAKKRAEEIGVSLKDRVWVTYTSITLDNPPPYYLLDDIDRTPLGPIPIWFSRLVKAELPSNPEKWVVANRDQIIEAVSGGPERRNNAKFCKVYTR